MDLSKRTVSLAKGSLNMIFLIVDFYNKDENISSKANILGFSLRNDFSSKLIKGFLSIKAAKPEIFVLSSMVSVRTNVFKIAFLSFKQLKKATLNLS